MTVFVIMFFSHKNQAKFAILIFMPQTMRVHTIVGLIQSSELEFLAVVNSSKSYLFGFLAKLRYIFNRNISRSMTSVSVYV